MPTGSDFYGYTVTPLVPREGRPKRDKRKAKASSKSRARNRR